MSALKKSAPRTTPAPPEEIDASSTLAREPALQVVDFAFPYIDFVYSIAFPIGIVLALFGHFAIVGPMTLAVLPLNLLLAAIMFHFSRQAFEEVGLKVRRNRLGYVGYLFTYQLFMSPVSVAGYLQELFGAARRW